jgi:signal transduction histidine kinase
VSATYAARIIPSFSSKDRMRLAAFITANTPSILVEWENFAQTLVPAAQHMSPLALRNHIRGLLSFITEDMQSDQSASEQKTKSRGESPILLKHSAAEIHASIRLAGGFTMDQMVAEYRTLRASIIHLWEEQLPEKSESDLLDMIRFNESIRHYTRKLDYSRGIFLGILGHDLRNPLSAVRMSAQLAMKMGGLNDRQSMLMSQVVECTDRATEIVTHLLDLTRARLGSGLPVVREHTNMEFVARVIVEETRTMHPDRTVTIDVSGNTEGEWDKPRIGQLLSNLLGNAIQYGFRDVPINVIVEGDGDAVVVSVHNYGIPIAPDALNHIFDSLVRGNDYDDEKHPALFNLGLGLYISKEIVTSHHGMIDVKSTEKDGTMFTARLPRTALVDDEPTHTKAHLVPLY